MNPKNTNYGLASKSNRMKKGRYPNEKLVEIKKNLQAMEKALDLVVDGEKTMVEACKDTGIISYKYFRDILAFASLLTSERDYIRNDSCKIVITSPVEQIYADVFGLPIDDELLDAIPFDAKETLDYLFDNYEKYGLTEREVKVFKMRVFDKLSLEEVGNEFGVTRERIRQLEQRAIRKLRSPMRSKVLKNGITLEKELLKIKQDEINVMVEERKKEMVEAKIQEEKIYREMQKGKMPIEHLNLSVRSYNCLKREELNTLEQVANLSVFELKHIRNLGARSVNEIVERVREYYPDYLINEL